MAHDHDWRPIADFIQHNLATDPAQAIDQETPLLTSGLIESFSLVQLVVHLETLFKIKIPAAFRTEEHFDSVGAILDLIRSLEA